MSKILLIYRQESAVGYYRQRIPQRILTALGHEVEFAGPFYSLRPDNPAVADSELLHDVPFEQRRCMAFLIERAERGFDFLLHDRCSDTGEQGAYAWFRDKSPGCKMSVDFDDDFMNVPAWNPAKKYFVPGKQSYEVGIWDLKLAELATVSTEDLVSKYTRWTHRILHAPNLIDPADWTGFPVNPDRAADPCLRILYGGACGHYGDMDDARDGLMEVLLNPPCPLRLICFGAIPKWMHDIRKSCPEAAARVISLPWVPFVDYPAAIAWGGFDLAIAPLAAHPFNDGKSNIKFLESAIQDIAFLGSRVGPYASIPDSCAMLVDNTLEAWKEGLTELLLNANLRKSLRTQANEFVRSSFLPDNGAKVWQNVLDALQAAPRISDLSATKLPEEADLGILDPSEKRSPSLEQGGHDALDSDNQSQ